MFSRKTYLHVSYESYDGNGMLSRGDCFLSIGKKADINMIRKELLGIMIEKEPTAKWNSPAILSMTILKKKLYKQLVGNDSNGYQKNP